MSFLNEMQKVEKEVAEYSEVAGKDLEEIFAEIKNFVVGKKVEAANAAAASTNDNPPSPKTVA